MKNTEHIEMAHSARRTTLEWRRDGAGWRLFAGRRRFGRVIPDSRYPGMWHSVLATGQLSDMANLSWARNAVLEVALRELEFDDRQAAATDPRKCPENEGVCGAPSTATAFGAEEAA
jgi:hypothetical protein